MKKFYFVLGLVLLFGNANGQKISLNDIPLSKSDFEIKQGFRNHPYSAKIYTNIDGKAEGKMINKKQVLIIEANLSVNSKSSWIKKEFWETATKEQKQELMNHEKGHLLIALIQFKKMQKICLEYTFVKADAKSQLDSIFKRTRSISASLNLAYDEETNHMVVKDKQLEWIGASTPIATDKKAKF